MTLFYLTCVLTNFLHIYQICEQYFYYDVTTNVRIGFPEIVEFPSITLCAVLVSILKWEKMSTDLRRSLLLVALPELTNETLLSQMASDPSFIDPDINTHHHAWDELSYNIYNRLVKEVSSRMIFNLTASFEEVFPVFTTTGLAHNSFGSDKQKLTEDRLTSGSDFQFTIDSTFIHDRHKCWTINIRSDLNTINFNELQVLHVKPRRLLTSWLSFFRSEIRVFLHSKGYLINTLDDRTVVGSRSHILTSFESHESVFLEYPYKTNCRDYTKIGFTSRKHCKEMCFKSKIIQRYKALVEDCHAFQSEDMFLLESEYPTNNQSIVRYFIRLCKKYCEERDCRTVTYHTDDDSFYQASNFFSKKCFVVTQNTSLCFEYRKYSEQFISPSYNVITFTETQPAIPLVSFLTELFSTFGFWMGLSVTGSLIFVRDTWIKVTGFTHQIKSRQRLTLQKPIDEQLNSIIRWTTHINAILQQMYIRERINRLHNMQSRVHDH